MQSMDFLKLQEQIGDLVFLVQPRTVCDLHFAISDRRSDTNQSTLSKRLRKKGSKDAVKKVLAVTGHSKKCSYLHDMIYRMPKLYQKVGHPQRCAMEAMEHGQRSLKETLRNMVSKGGKLASGEEVRRNRAAIALRFACTPSFLPLREARPDDNF